MSVGMSIGLHEGSYRLFCSTQTHATDSVIMLMICMKSLHANAHGATQHHVTTQLRCLVSSAPVHLRTMLCVFGFYKELTYICNGHIASAISSSLLTHCTQQRSIMHAARSTHWCSDCSPVEVQMSINVSSKVGLGGIHKIVKPQERVLLAN
jgi:hypothetical protein